MHEHVLTYLGYISSSSPCMHLSCIVLYDLYTYIPYYIRLITKFDFWSCTIMHLHLVLISTSSTFNNDSDSCPLHNSGIIPYYIQKFDHQIWLSYRHEHVLTHLDLYHHSHTCTFMHACHVCNHVYLTLHRYLNLTFVHAQKSTYSFILYHLPHWTWQYLASTS